MTPFLLFGFALIAALCEKSSAQCASDDPFAILLQNMDVAAFSAMPDEVLMSIPLHIILMLGPEYEEALPAEAKARMAVEQQLQTAALAQVIKATPVSEVGALPWDTLIETLPADAYNEMKIITLGAIPWADVFHKMPAEVAGGLEYRVATAIPEAAWKIVSVETFQALNPRIYNNLPYSSLVAVPLGHWTTMDPARLTGVDPDILFAIDSTGGLLESVLGVQEASSGGTIPVNWRDGRR